MAFPVVLAAAGAGLSAVGQISSGLAAARAGKLNARIAQANARAQQRAAEVEARESELNAQMAEQDAELARQARAFREARAKEQIRRDVGTARAVVAASGVGLEGSPIEAIEENLRQRELDILADRFNTELQVRASRQEARTQEFQAEVSRFQGREAVRIGRNRAAIARFRGRQALVGSFFKAGGSLLTGAGRVRGLLAPPTNNAGASAPSSGPFPP